MRHRDARRVEVPVTRDALELLVAVYSAPPGDEPRGRGGDLLRGLGTFIRGEVVVARQGLELDRVRTGAQVHRVTPGSQRHVLRVHNDPTFVERGAVHRVPLLHLPRASEVIPGLDQSLHGPPAHVLAVDARFQHVVVYVLVPQRLLRANHRLTVPTRQRLRLVLQYLHHASHRLVEHPPHPAVRSRVLGVYPADVHAVEVSRLVLGKQGILLERSLQQRIRVNPERHVGVDVHRVVPQLNEPVEEVKPDPPEPERSGSLLGEQLVVLEPLVVLEVAGVPASYAPRAVHQQIAALGFVRDYEIVLDADAAKVGHGVCGEDGAALVRDHDDNLLTEGPLLGRGFERPRGGQVLARQRLRLADAPPLSAYGRGHVREGNGAAGTQARPGAGCGTRSRRIVMAIRLRRLPTGLDLLTFMHRGCR